MIKLILISIFIFFFIKNLNSQLCKSSLGHFSGDCKSLSDCAGGAFESNICQNNKICCVNDPDLSDTIFPEPTLVDFTLKSFLKLTDDTPRNKALYSLFSKFLNDNNVDNCHLAAVLFSQLAGETKLFTRFESDRPEKDIDPLLGNDQLGDGSKYRRRGPLGLTGKKNYFDAYSKLSSKLTFNITDLSESLAIPSTGFLVASWIWKENLFVILNNRTSVKGSLNSLADGTYFNFTQITHSITNNLDHLKERSILYEKTVNELKCNRIKRGKGIDCEIGSNKGYTVPICLNEHKRSYCGCDGDSQRGCPYGYNSNNKCRNSGVVQCCVEKCLRGLDLVFLVDASESIKLPNFLKIKKFLQSFVNKLEISEGRTRFSLIKFSTDVEAISYLSDYNNKDTTLELIDQMNYDAGITNTGSALKFVNERVLIEENGMRKLEEGIPRVVVLLTDGQSNEGLNLTISTTEKIKDKKVNFMCLGIGKEINSAELEIMASSLDDIYTVDKFDELSIVLDSMIKSTCQQPAKILQNLNVKAFVDKGDYKFFKIEMNDTSLTVEVESTKGQIETYYSDFEEAPKNEDEYIEIVDKNNTETFVEKKSILTKDFLIAENKTLFLGIRGLDFENEFKITVIASNSTNLTTTEATNSTDIGTLNSSSISISYFTSTFASTLSETFTSSLSSFFRSTTTSNYSESYLKNFTIMSFVLPLIILVFLYLPNFLQN